MTIIKFNQLSAKGDEFSLPCEKCSGRPAHAVLCDLNSEDGDDHITSYADYCVVQCGGCKTLSFCRRSMFSEDWEHDEYGNMVLNETFLVFPQRGDGRKMLAECDMLPKKLGVIYIETYHSLVRNSRVLTAVGIRAIIDAVAMHKKITGHDLYHKINNMVPIGLISAESAKMLHKIRVLGNKSAHEVKENKESELQMAMDIVEHLLVSVYLLPIKAKKIRTRR